MEERKKKKEAEQQPLQRRHRGATATTTEEITAGGAVCPYGQTKHMKAPYRKLLWKGRGKKASQPLTPTQISIDPANLSAIKAERT